MAVNCVGICCLWLRKLYPPVRVAVFPEVCDLSCPSHIQPWMLVGDLEHSVETAGETDEFCKGFGS